MLIPIIINFEPGSQSVELTKTGVIDNAKPRYAR